jgi:putative ABC transport system permease protein
MYVRAPSTSTSIRTTLVVRLADPRSAATIGVVEASIRTIDPGVRVTAARTIRAYVDDSLYRDRLIAVLASGFSVLALGIAAVGLFGVLAVAVAGQTREIGVRMALGADARRIARFVAGPAISLVSAGLVLGLCGAALLAPVVSSLLFGLETVDAPTAAGVAATLAVAAGVACYVPARRAVRIDPASVLRGE